MCAIFGMGLVNGHRVSDLKNLQVTLDTLFRESQIRGSSASGIAFLTPKEIPVIKGPFSAKKMVETEEYRKMCEKFMTRNSRLIGVIGHCRAPTKGSEYNNRNNHPIVARKVIGVHNGHIGNDDELFSEFEQYAGDIWERSGQVDSEIIFRLLDFYIHKEWRPGEDAVKAATNNMEGGYACAFVTLIEKYKIYLFRNYNPIDVVYYPQIGLMVFASSKKFIDKAVHGLELGHRQDLEVPRYSGMCINLLNRKVRKFDLEPERSGNQVAGFNRHLSRVNSAMCRREGISCRGGAGIPPRNTC